MEMRWTTFAFGLLIPSLLTGCCHYSGNYSYASIQCENIQHEEVGLVPGAVRYAHQDSYFRNYYYYNRYHYYNYPRSYYRTSFPYPRSYSNYYRRPYYDTYPGFYFNLGYTPRDYYYNPGFYSQTYYYRGSF